jgi:BolA family transcriptional regulator, general stress-responsive regulator
MIARSTAATVVTIPPAFAGKSRVDRQRMVYKALGELMRERVHALQLRARAPGED